MANKPGEANFFPDIPQFPSMGTFQPVYGKFDLTTYIQGASDYEIMAFLVGKYNACLEAYDNITKLSTDTITACKQLQDWINSWFTNLDVQEELNNKIDSMVQDGSFGQLLHQTFDTQINQQAANATTAWLVANVTPAGSAVVVDKSLTIEGAAADAKATGKGINTVQQYLDSSELNKYNVNTKFVDGKYIDSAGALVDYEGWRTSDFITINKNVCILSFENTNIQYNYNNAFYDEQRQFIGAFIANKLVRVPKNARYLRCSFENSVFDKAYFTSATYNDYLTMLRNTLYIQSNIEISEYDKNFTYSVIFKPFNAAILGYYKEPYTDAEKYIAVGTTEDAVDGKYTINIPLYSALVLDATKFASNTSYIVEVKGYNDITENDLVLFYNNCSSQAKQYQMGGLLYNAFYYIKKENNDDIMKSVCRFGISYGQPESADSVVAAKKAGYNYYRCNLQCTKEGIFVLWHDPALNQYYKNVYDGNILVPYSDTNKIVISQTNLSALNQYKYGSTDYNAGIPTLEMLLKSCRINDMKLYLESKMAFTSEQIANLYDLISRYGMTDKTSIVLSKSNAEMLAKIDKSIRVGVDYADFSEDVKNTFIELTGLFDNVFWWGWSTMTLTKDIVDFLSKHNIEFECGDFGSTQSVDTYLSNNYSWYCTGMELEETMSPLISDYLKNNY